MDNLSNGERYMYNSDLVSVIVPVYNAETTIQRCVESIINNDYKNIEIILIDDDSKDNSLKICRDMSIVYSNICVLHNDINKGVSYSRNKGIDNARGYYLIFIDSDDYVENNYFSTLLDCYNNNGLTLCGYYIDSWYGRDESISILYSDRDTDVLSVHQLEYLHEKMLIQQLWNKVFLRHIIVDNNIRFDENISVGEDFKFILEYLRITNNEIVTVVNKCLYHYLKDNNSSLMNKVNYSHLKIHLDNLKDMYLLIGYDEKQSVLLVENEKEKMTKMYAYMIFRNKNMSFKDKRYNIYNLDSKLGKKLFKDNVILYIKEMIRRFI